MPFQFPDREYFGHRGCGQTQKNAEQNQLLRNKPGCIRFNGYDVLHVGSSW